MTFDRRIVGFHIENLEIWSISYEILHFADTPSYLNSRLSIFRGPILTEPVPLDGGSTSFFTPTSVNTV